ncbi:DUF4097 family beta strand repeat-containing protein [Lactonifactor longoviformis]|uniref:DUF4097 family beta strand repeat-containing protein n=1 Tax=Lactonifactor longoviformis TaxID=341220 RepID=UPI0036F2C3F4
MKKFTKISLIASGVLAVVGIAFLISGFVMGVSWQEVEDTFEFHTAARWFEEHGDITEGSETSHSFSAGEIKKLEIEFNKGDLYLSETDGDEIRVSTFNRKDKVNQENGTLKIESRGRVSNDNTIEIEIPRGMSFDEVELKIDAGSGQVDNLKTKELEAEVNAGDLTLYEDIAAAKVKLDVNAGSLDTELLDAKEVEIKCDAGSVSTTLSGKQNDYQIEMKGDLASVSLDGFEYSGLSTKKQWGDSNASRKLEAKCNAGSLDIEFELD